MALQAAAERSGVVRDADGFLVIPGSRRPDGSMRKPVRVKEGYIPQDEQPTYENRGTKWLKDRPACPGLSPDPEPAKGNTKQYSERTRKKKDKKSKASKTSEEEVTRAMAEASITSVVMSVDELRKELRNLKKTLRHIDELKEKIDSGELAEPTAAQQKEVGERDEIMKKIEAVQSQL